MWAPVSAGDNKAAAVSASAYLDDPRAEHYWDLWNFASSSYTRQLGYPQKEIAWDMLTFYAPGLFWKGAPPEPTLWMQNRGLPIGAKFDAAALKTELQKRSR